MGVGHVGPHGGHVGLMGGTCRSHGGHVGLNGGEHVCQRLHTGDNK